MRTIRQCAKWVGLIVILASIWPLARAAAWNEANTAPTKTLTGGTGLSIAIDTAFDSAGNLYVLNLDMPKKSVNVYPAGRFNGHTAPVKHIDLDVPGLSLSIAIDSDDNLYVAAYPVSGISVYDDISTWAADGTTQPIKTLDVFAPRGIALDATDNLYVVDSEKVRMFDDISTWNQNGVTQPIKSLVGNNTGLNAPASVALDEFDNMYVSNGGNNSITFYATGWSDGDTAPTKTLVGSSTGLDAPGSIAFDGSGKMFVSSGCYICGVTPIGPPKVLAFVANWASGNTTPVKALIGDRTKLVSGVRIGFDTSGVMFASIQNRGVVQFAANWVDGNTAPIGLLADFVPTGIAVDQHGRMYVANQPLDSITVYGADWAEGQAEPVKILFGGNTGLSSPIGISFDNVGNMYVANSAGYYGVSTPPSITVYGPDWANGNTTPIKTLIGSSTGLDNPASVAFDSRNNMYVANYASDSVTMYSAGWASGNTAPVKTLVGSNTGLDIPIDLKFDSADNMYVSNDNTGRPSDPEDAVNVFAAGWADGDTAPIAFLRGPDTGLDIPDGLAIGSNGKIYVTNIQGNSVTVYGDFTTWAADGNTAPIKTLSGAATGLGGPWGIAFDAFGNMYVANAYSVTMYAGEIPPPETTTTTTTTTTSPPITTDPPTTIPLVPEVFVLPATL